MKGLSSMKTNKMIDKDTRKNIMYEN